MRLVIYDGVRYLLASQTDEAVYELHKQLPQIKADIQGMRDSQSGEQKWFHRQDNWDIKEAYGITTVVVQSKSGGVVKKKRIESKVDIVSRPVPVYVTGDDGGNLTGTICCRELDWKSIFFFQEETDWTRWELIPFNCFTTNNYLKEEQIRVYPLELISRGWRADDTPTEVEVDNYAWGENEEYATLEEAVLGPGTWTATGWGVTATEYNSGDVFIQRYPNCMFNYAIGFNDTYTHSYLTNHLIAKWSGDYGDPPPASPEWPIDGIQYWTNRWTRTTSNSIIAENGDTIVSAVAVAGVTTQSIGDLNFGGDCNSSTTKDTYATGESLTILSDCGVISSDGYTGYDENTYLITYMVTSEVSNSIESCTPWIHWPGNGTLEDESYSIVRSEKYFITANSWINGESKSISFEFAEPYVGLLSYQVDVYQTEIYDFNGVPVFVWSWKDFRTNTANYGMIYGEGIYISEPFDIITAGWPNTHDVYGSLINLITGSLSTGAKAAGIEVITTTYTELEE
jgi:hypothetical protein